VTKGQAWLDVSIISNRSAAGRLLRAPLRLLPAHMWVPILQGPLRGQWWIIGSATHGCWLGSYEFKKQRCFASALKPGDVVYDIGTHAGFYSLLAAVQVGSEGRVVAFEPLPRNLAFLRAHLTKNKLTNVIVQEVALSDRRGTRYLDDSAGSSQARLAADGSHAVECRTLDELVESGIIPPPDLIKIDVEGAELSVLLGGEATIRTRKPVLFVATHDADTHAAC